jgi:hypothetical protein
VIRSPSPCDVQTLLDSIGNELFVGQTSLRLSWHMADDLSKKDDVFALSPWFFLWTGLSLFNGACLTLARLFDDGKNAVTLKKLVDCAADNAGLCKGSTPDQVRKLVEKLRKQTSEMKKVMTPVLTFRNKFLAHRSIQAGRNEKLALADQSVFRDLDGLYKRARSLVNCVSQAYKGSDAIILFDVEQSGGWNDYRRLLELAERQLRAEDRATGQKGGR